MTNQGDKAARRRKGATDTDSRAVSSRALAQALGKIAAVVILIILAVLIERYCSYKPPPFGPGVKIVSIDGDSLRAGDGSEYRIFGIDAPELHQTCKEANGKAWACGRAAKARLTTLMKEGNVNCIVRDKDRFGRAVAVCSAQGVPDLGDAMVRQGYAIDLGGAAGNPYHEAEVEAQSGKRGIWRGSFERPSDWRLAHPRESDESD
jgi:endonuclease YncB( thermonuclease family)